MVASSSTDYQGPMPMDVDPAQDTKGRVRKARMTIRRAKVKMPKAKERKGKEKGQEKKVSKRAKVKVKTKTEKVWQLVTLVGSQDIWLETVGETIYFRQVASDTAHSSSGGASDSYSWSTASQCESAK